MTDSTTEVAKAAQAILEPGEELIASLAAHPAHRTAPTPGAATSLVRTGVGGLVMGELLDCYHAAAAPLAGEASGVPRDFHFWIALTSQRLLFFEGGVIARLGSRIAPEGSARVLYSEIPLADVLAIEPLGAFQDERLELRFSDESRATVICAHKGEGGAFRLAFEEAKRVAAS